MRAAFIGLVCVVIGAPCLVAGYIFGYARVFFEVGMEIADGERDL